MTTTTHADWMRLTGRMDALTAATGWGLARTWGLVHEGRYAEALARFERTRKMLGVDV